MEGTPGDYLVQTPLLRQGQLEQAAQHCDQLGFEYFHRWKLYNVSGQPVPCFLLFDPTVKKKVPISVQVEFPEFYYFCPLPLVLPVSTAEKSSALHSLPSSIYIH